LRSIARIRFAERRAGNKATGAYVSTSEMEHAHVCKHCESITIFAVDARYPRRCARCRTVLRFGAPDVKRSVRESPGEIEIDRVAS